MRKSLFNVKLEYWDRNTPSNSPEAPGTNKKFWKDRVHWEELSKSVRLTGGVLARPISGKDDMRRPCNKKDAPAKHRGIWRNIYKLNNSDKITFSTPIEAKVMLAPTSTRSEEREFVVDSGAWLHMLSKKDLSSEEVDTVKSSRTPTMVLTTNGDVHTHEDAQVFFHDLNLFVTVQLLEETPAGLSLGKTLRRPRIFLWVGQRSKATIDQRREDNCMQNRQLRTSCCSKVIHQFWKQLVGNIDTAGFVVNKSSSRAKWRTSSTIVVRITLWDPKPE